MMRPAACAIAICLAVGGCDKDPARSMKIATRPAAVAADSVATPPSAVAPPRDAETAPPAKSEAAPPAAVKAAVVAAPMAKAPSAATKSAPRAKIAASTAAGTTAPTPAEKSAAGPSRSDDWRPAGCPIPKEGGTGPSKLTVTGPCAFQHHGKFTCEALADDFYISMTRKAAEGATLMFYINIERFHGAGEYKGAQMWIGVQGKKDIYRWSSDAVAITVGPDQAFAVLPTTRLDAEPVLVDCTGPLDNYQCRGRGDLQELLAIAEVVAGTMHCEAGAINK